MTKFKYYISVFQCIKLGLMQKDYSAPFAIRKQQTMNDNVFWQDFIKKNVNLEGTKKNHEQYILVDLYGVKIQRFC